MKAGSYEKQLQRYQWLKFLFFAGAITATLLVLLKVENMLLSALIAFVMAYLLGPIVDSFERTGLNRIVSITLTFAIMSLLVAFGVIALTPFVSAQFNSFRAELPKYIEGTTYLIQDVETNFEIISGAVFSFNLSDQVETLLLSWTSSLFEDLPAIVSKSLTVLLLAPFLAFFLLKDGRGISRSLLTLVPNSIFELILNLYHQINDQMGQFIRARILEAAFVGTVVWLGLWIVDFPYATLLAIFAALTNLIPYVGPFIGAIPALIIALINGNPPVAIFLMLGVYLIAQIIDVVFIIPLVVAKIVDLHPVTVMISLLIGAQLLGVLGMLISIPVASALKVTLVAVYQHIFQFKT